MFTAIKRALSTIHLVDGCLMIFMAVFLMQSAYSMLFYSDNSQNSSIDVIVRTSSSAIFGYFLSANFTKRAQSQDGDTAASEYGSKTVRQIGTDNSPVGRMIGFDTSERHSDDTVIKAHNARLSKREDNGACRQQIFVATATGLFCLITLLILRNVTGEDVDNPAVTATAVQFRDFVSGCVGFLIGCPTQKTDG